MYILQKFSLLLFCSTFFLISIVGRVFIPSGNNNNNNKNIGKYIQRKFCFFYEKKKSCVVFSVYIMILPKVIFVRQSINLPGSQTMAPFGKGKYLSYVIVLVMCCFDSVISCRGGTLISKWKHFSFFFLFHLLLKVGQFNFIVILVRFFFSILTTV